MIFPQSRLLEEASLNMAYLWFLGYEIDEPLPDHSIMTKARMRFGPDAFRAFFHRVVRACIGAGLVEGEAAFLDSTLIDTKNRLYDVRSKVLVKQLTQKSETFVATLFEDKSKVPTLPAKVNGRLAHPQDPDADTVSRDNLKAGLRYKGHIAVDRRHRDVVHIRKIVKQLACLLRM